ncbi:MAG: hypothetical protein ACE5IY_04020 [bacterium]
MKIALWISFYFLTFLGLVVGMYLSKDKVVEKTAEVPVFNYTKYHRDAAVKDSTYTEHIDSLAVVVEGLLNQLTEYVSQLQDRDLKIAQQDFEINKLKQQNVELQKLAEKQKKSKTNYHKAQEEKKLQELAKMLGEMKAETLAPILANLPDRLVQIFYDKAKAKDRIKIFKALPPARAGKILKNIAGGSR